MTSFATVRVIGLVLLASPLVLVYFAAWIVCLHSASLNWMSRASPDSTPCVCSMLYSDEYLSISLPISTPAYVIFR